MIKGMYVAFFMIGVMMVCAFSPKETMLETYVSSHTLSTQEVLHKMGRLTGADWNQMTEKEKTYFLTGYLQALAIGDFLHHDTLGYRICPFAYDDMEKVQRLLDEFYQDSAHSEFLIAEALASFSDSL